MSLPACLTKFDAAEFAASEAKPKRFYDVILSRPARAIFVGPLYVGMYAGSETFRCLLTLEGLDDRLRDGYRTTVLREFDEYPG